VLDGIGPDGGRIWQPEMLRDARTIRNPGFLDPVFRKPANRGLGIVIAGGPDKFVLGFGRPGSSEDWWQPQLDLSFAAGFLRVGWAFASRILDGDSASARDAWKNAAGWWSDKVRAGLKHLQV
jgi:hypothetical protein